MNILITGASGFIGQKLVACLAPQHKLTLLSRTPAKAQQKLGKEHCYLQSLDTLPNLNQFDAVINLAGEPIVAKRWTAAQKHTICHSRWDITAQLSQLFSQSHQPPKVFISGSAIGFYGRHHAELLDESSPAHDEFSHHVCQRWETLALESATITRVCLLRTGIVLGHGGALEKMLPPFKLGLGGPIGHGRQGMSWIHIDDMVALIQFLLTNEHCQGIYNATAPHPLSNKQFSQILAKCLNRPALLPLPGCILRLAMGEMADLLLGGQFVYPKRAITAGFDFQYPELTTALQNILSS